jgi:hypothetical protein
MRLLEKIMISRGKLIRSCVIAALLLCVCRSGSAQTAAAIVIESRTAQLDGMKMHYLTAGKGLTTEPRLLC